jgi:menaquinone-9 beta-reductase
MFARNPARVEHTDVAVIGGGPAGSAVSLRLAQHGIQVMQFERRHMDAPSGDRFRSGEGVLPATLAALQRLHIPLHAGQWALAEATRLRVYWPDGRATEDHLPSGRLVRTLDRGAFDLMLWQAARAAGVDNRCGWSVRQLLCQHNQVKGICATDRSGDVIKVRARVVIDAGGRNAPSLRQFDLRRHEHGSDFVVVVMFFDQVPDMQADTWEMHFFDRSLPTVVQGAYLEEGVTRFGLGTYLHAKQGTGLTPEAFFWQRLKHHPRLEQRLRAARTIQAPFVRARLGYRAVPVARPGLLLIGDAAGYLSPILGDGITMALRSAELAAGIVREGFARSDLSVTRLKQYERQYRQARRYRRWITHLLMAAHRRPDVINLAGHSRLLRRLALLALTRS